MTTLLRMTSQQEQPLSYVHCAWLHWKAGASVFTEGKHERKTVLVLEERGMKEEEREGKREMRRKREWNSFHCIAIHNRFHHMSLVYSLNKNTFVLHFGFTISEIIMLYS